MDDQLRTSVAEALPGRALREARPLGKRSLLLTLDDGRRVVLRQSAQSDEWAGEPVCAEARALRALRGAFDLPLPELLAYRPAGRDGRPYALLSFVEGQPLPAIIGELSEEQRYKLGRRLGEVMLQVHAYTAPAYGLLPEDEASWRSEDPAAMPPEPEQRKKGERRPPPRPPAGPNGADLAYLTGRLSLALDVALQHGELDQGSRVRMLDWVQTNAALSGQRAALVHGDLRPERVLLRRRDRSWQIAGVVGWGYAQAWRPGWDHVMLLESFAGADYFSLRVGYGNAYEEVAARTYDQLRNLALLPYRLVLYLEAGRADLAMHLLDAADAAAPEGSRSVEE